jgi:MFS family permease
MIPSAEDIATGRWRLAAWLRVIALVGMLVSVPSMLSWLAEGLRDNDLWDYGYYASRMVLSIGGAVGGILVFVLAPSLARALLPVPVATECPRCRYVLAGAGGDRCPECGLPVGDAFIRSALAPGGRARRRRSRTLDEISPAMFLLGAFWSVIVAALLLLALTARMGVSGLLIGAVGAAPIILSQMLALRLGARVVALRSRESETDPKTRQEAT